MTEPGVGQWVLQELGAAVNDHEVYGVFLLPEEVVGDYFLRKGNDPPRVLVEWALG